jgi:hypothetical protein
LSRRLKLPGGSRTCRSRRTPPSCVPATHHDQGFRRLKLRHGKDRSRVHRLSPGLPLALPHRLSPGLPLALPHRGLQTVLGLPQERLTLASRPLRHGYLRQRVLS